MGVGEVVDVSAGVVHIIRPELRFAVGWRDRNSFAWIFVDRVVSLDFKCNSSCLLRLFGLKVFKIK